jgi:hypothetical protein
LRSQFTSSLSIPITENVVFQAFGAYQTTQFSLVRMKIRLSRTVLQPHPDELSSSFRYVKNDITIAIYFFPPTMKRFTRLLFPRKQHARA